MFGAFSSYFSLTPKAEEKEDESSTQEVFDSEWTLLEEQSPPHVDLAQSDTSDFCRLSDVSASEDFHYLSSPAPSSPVLLSPIGSLTLSNVDLSPNTNLIPYLESPSYSNLLADSASYDSPKLTFSFCDLRSTPYVNTDIFIEGLYLDDVFAVPSYCNVNNVALGKKEMYLVKKEEGAEKRAVSVSLAKQKNGFNAKQLSRNNKVTHKHSNRRRGGNLGRRKC